MGSKISALGSITKKWSAEMTEPRDLRLRIQEVSISVAAAILTSAFATYTTIQVTLAETRDKSADAFYCARV